ncbi:MAG: RNA chaperone Hfq [Abditibacteriota bacterium]|nr:RNA chaperone Hfq [Abditibacteriota bacterium]
MKSGYNLQDQYLNCARKEKIPVTIFLQNGVSLKGLVKGFDVFTVILEQMPGKPWTLVYKHAIVSVVPKENITGLNEPCCCDEGKECKEGGEAGEGCCEAKEGCGE